MAEFCTDCIEKMDKDPDAKYRYSLSRDFDLCEGCGEWKRVVVGYNPFYPCNAILHRIFNRRKRSQTDAKEGR